MLAVHGAKFQTMVIHFDFAELALNSCPNLVTLAFRPLEVCIYTDLRKECWLMALPECTVAWQDGTSHAAPRPS